MHGAERQESGQHPRCCILQHNNADAMQVFRTSSNAILSSLNHTIAMPPNVTSLAITTMI
jgi:hypothetical protein